MQRHTILINSQLSEQGIIQAAAVQYATTTLSVSGGNIVPSTAINSVPDTSTPWPILFLTGEKTGLLCLL